MRAFEYFAQVLSDGHLSLPEPVWRRLKSRPRVRVQIWLDDDDPAGEELPADQGLDGYCEHDAAYDPDRLR